MLQRCSGVVARVKAVKTRTQSLVQLNLELAKLEGKQKATAVGIAGGLAAVAGVLLVYAIGFAFAAIAAGLSEALSLWLSLLIVAGILVLGAAIAGFLAMRFARKASPRSRRRRSRKQRARSRRCRAMSEQRGAEEIRKEIAAERQRLDADLNALQAELRSLVPLVVAGLAVVALVTFRKRTTAGLRMMWRLI